MSGTRRRDFLGITGASTAEVDRYPYAWLDMVRPGSCLVGLESERQTNTYRMTTRTRTYLPRISV